MRIIFQILILLVVSTSSLKAVANKLDSEKNFINIFQARGLHRNFCYREMAALTCKERCLLSLFPNTKAQLDLHITKISNSEKKRMGHLFEAKFKVLSKSANEIEVRNLKSVDFKTFKASINRADGIMRPTTCEQ